MAHGFVLIGGASRRMGRDKALVLFRGQPLASVQAEKLAEVCGGVSLCAKLGFEEFSLGLPAVSDLREGRAAVFGIEAGLFATVEEWNVFLAVDLPLVSVRFLSSLLGMAVAGGDLALAGSSNGRVQPLCSVWRKSALVSLQEAIERGNLSVQRLIPAIGGRILSETETRGLDGYCERGFANLNAPEDLGALERMD